MLFFFWQLDEDDKDDSVTTPDEDLVLKLVQKLQPKLVRSCSNTGNDQGQNIVSWNFKMKEWKVIIAPMGLSPDVFYSQQNLRFLCLIFLLSHSNLAFDLVVCGFVLITDQSGSLTYPICIVLPETCIPLSQLVWRKQVHNIGQAFEGISHCVVGVCEFVMEVFYFFSLQPELSYVWYWYHSRKRNWTPCCHWYQLFSW